MPLINPAIRAAGEQKNDARALMIILIWFGIYAVSLWSILNLALPFAIMASFANGIAIAMCFVIGHDTSHLSFFSTPRRNRIAGRLVFLPGFIPFSAWHIIHNVRHHGFSNIKDMDGVWEPMAPAEFTVQSRGRQWRYRFYRSYVGVFAFWIIQYWFRRFMLPRKAMIGQVKLVHWVDALCCWAFLAAVNGLILVSAQNNGQNPALMLLLGYAIPMTVWMALISAAIYIQHTHPSVPWYLSVKEWRNDVGRVRGTVRVTFPKWIDFMIGDAMEHTAHHYLSGVPIYNLRKVQDALPADSYTQWRWSFAAFGEIVRTCKLYDFANRRWVPFP